jgi:tRNA(Leu) C34 or U34 (ribose-2'-O)-methylase TrmL
MFHVILLEPEIPPNTGNVIRLCANTGATLHLVRPLGFELTRKAVRRAGLDYQELAEVRVHASLAPCLEAWAVRGFTASRPAARGSTARRRSRRAMRCSSAPRPAACRRGWSRSCRTSGSSRSRCAPITAA